MSYLALATDYDGTLADKGHVRQSTLAALERLRAAGRALLLVTGREVPELLSIFPRVELFDLVVAENGALLYWPRTGQERSLGSPPPDSFISEVRRRGVSPFSLGQVIFATWRPHDAAVLEVLQELKLDYHVIYNKRAVMVLPTGINKATGLSAALEILQLPAAKVVGIGDAENDHAFLERCGLSVAVSNALPALKEHCDLVTEGDHGDGVSELIDRWLADPSRLVPRYVESSEPTKSEAD